MQGLSEQQRMIFMGQMSSQRKDPNTALLLSLLLGGVGAHRFYMGEVGLGAIYLIFAFTFVPALVALLECFVIRDRVTNYNNLKALDIAQQVRYAFPISA